MSSKSSAEQLTPLHKPPPKKRQRPNFRPQKRSKAVPSSAKEPTEAPEKNDKATKKTDETAEMALESSPAVETNNLAATEAAPVDALVAVGDDAEPPTEGRQKQAKDVSTSSPKKNARSPAARRGRKRKTTGVAVGASRSITAAAAAEETERKDEAIQTRAEQHRMLAATVAASLMIPSQDSNALVELPSQSIPANTTGAPGLRSFCSSFKSKPKKKEKAATKESKYSTSREVQQSTAGQRHAGPVVQVVNGEIVLQESSMVFAGGTSTAADQPLPEEEVVEEEAQLAVVGASYHSFVPHTRHSAPQHWSVEETVLFYKALRQVGTDFGTMEAYFDSSSKTKRRTRKQLKRKYQTELTRNPALVEKALDPASRVDIDLSIFELSMDAIQKSKKAEQPKEQQPSLTKADDGAKESLPQDASKTNESPVAAPDQTPRIDAERIATAPDKTGDEEPLWPDDEVDAAHQDESHDATFKDPLLVAEEEEEYDEKGGAAETIGLIPGTAALPSPKKKKPKQRPKKIRPSKKQKVGGRK